MKTVELWTGFPGIVLIVKHPTGVEFTNQTGGMSCVHPKMEGVLIPIRDSEPESDSLENWADDVPSERHAKTARWLEENELDDLFEPDDESNGLLEAWVPVVIKAFSDRREWLRPLLGDFVGCRGVLTYQNSD